MEKENTHADDWTSVNHRYTVRTAYATIGHIVRNREDMSVVLRRLARLNENAGEIGDGMLRSLVAEARTVLKEGGFEV